MLLASVQPREACKPPAPKGSTDSESEKKKRAEILSWPARNSRSQFAVNWSSVYFPGFPTISVPVPPAVPEIDGIREPFGSLNWLLLKFSSASVTGSRPLTPEGSPSGKKAEIREG